MTSTSSEAVVVRGDLGHAATPSVDHPDLRAGTWTRLGASTVLGDSATEATLGALADRARASDLVVTGEGAFDFSSRAGKVPYGVAAVASEALRPCIALAGQVLVGSREMRALGIDQVNAPVLDVDTNPDNPVIACRSFGRTPDLVSRLGVALIDGIQSEGVAACGKHFPGHGDTSQDSHFHLPRLPHALDRLIAFPVGLALAGLGYSLWRQQARSTQQSPPSTHNARREAAGVA